MEVAEMYSSDANTGNAITVRQTVKVRRRTKAFRLRGDFFRHCIIIKTPLNNGNIEFFKYAAT